MILIDDREGSKELYQPLVRLGLEVSLDRLDSADIAFSGNGPQSSSWTIGIEHKTTQEALQAIETERFTGHQLPLMKETYDFCYLMVEGLWLEGDDGQLLVRSGKDYHPPKGSGRPWTFEGFWAWLQTISVLGGFGILLTANKSGSARVIRAVVKWWEKPWDSHNSLHSIYAKGRAAVASPLEKVTDTRRMLAQIPGVNWTLSGRAEEKFRTIQRAANAGEAEWESLEKIGPKKARSIVRFLQESTEPPT